VINLALRTRLEDWLQRQWQIRGVWAWLMSPLALLFGLVLTARRSTYRHLAHRRQKLTQDDRIKVPILVVGNIFIGGTGKTPVVIALVNALKARGWQPGVISRGYGTAIGDRPLVGQGQLPARQYGDEPAMIARESGVPICVHPDRLSACKTLLQEFPHLNLVISDDGLQHLRLPRDIELVVQDARGTGNGWLLPAGPLREPISRLHSVQAVLTRNDDLTQKEKKQSSLVAGGSQDGALTRHACVGLEIFRFRHVLDGRTVEPAAFLSFAQGLLVMAVAGIAMPTRFFKSLQTLGLDLSGALALPDHFSYDSEPFSEIDADLIVITGKDAVKCETTSDARIWVAEVTIHFSDPDFIPWLDHQLQIKSARSSHE